MSLITRAWQMLVGLVFLFAGWVSFALASGQLDPIGSAYYGVVVGWRESVLFALLGGLQGVAVVEAGVLAWRRRGWAWWLGLGVAAMTLPLLLVVAIAQLDLWRASHRGTLANVSAGCAMLALLSLGYLARSRAWAMSRTARKES